MNDQSQAEFDQLRQRAYEAAYSAEKARTSLRSAERIAGALLRDEATAKAGHDLLHDLSHVMAWLTAHDRAMKAWREALDVLKPPASEATPTCNQPFGDGYSCELPEGHL